MTVSFKVTEQPSEMKVHTSGNELEASKSLSSEPSL